MSIYAQYNKVTNDIKGLTDDTHKFKFNGNHRRWGNPGYTISTILKKDNEYDASTVKVEVYEPKRYRTGMENITCCVFVNDSRSGTHIRGSGSAGGCGYHKESAASGDAIRNAGIELKDSIDGVGDRAVEEAICQIMRALGYRRNQYVLTRS